MNAITKRQATGTIGGKRARARTALMNQPCHRNLPFRSGVLWHLCTKANLGSGSDLIARHNKVQMQRGQGYHLPHAVVPSENVTGPVPLEGRGTWSRLWGIPMAEEP